MSPELDAALCKDFPKLFNHRHHGMQETAMCWGFEHGDGWEPLIRELATKLEAINDILPNDLHIEASQVKEKYGTLRFYINAAPSAIADYVYQLIDEAEHKSAKTCDVCGKRGKLRGSGWYYTACKKHARNGDK
jgi:hypothetical protein